MAITEELKAIWKLALERGDITKEEAIKQISNDYNFTREEKQELIRFIQNLNVRQTKLSC